MDEVRVDEFGWEWTGRDEKELRIYDLDGRVPLYILRAVRQSLPRLHLTVEIFLSIVMGGGKHLMKNGA